MKSDASTDTVELSEATQDSFQVMTVELALVPTRVMHGLFTTTFSLQISMEYWRCYSFSMHVERPEINNEHAGAGVYYTRIN